MLYAMNKIFLSVITRTQGNRPVTLRQVLESLDEQTDGGFELLLMAHNVPGDVAAGLYALLAEFPSLSEKTRILPVMGGTRTKPLQAGFEAARGRYIAILDDDDLVYPNWVSAFRDLADAHGGKVLHTYVLAQEWSEAAGAAGPELWTHCRDFSLPDQLAVNNCPPLSVAFPREAFHEKGVRFDESLTTTEDWDYLMRAVFACGVADSPEVTGLYRLWTGWNARAAHDEAEWDKNRRKIIQKFLDDPPPFDKDDVRETIRTLDALHRELEALHATLAERTSELLATHERLRGVYESKTFKVGSALTSPFHKK